MSVIHHPGSKYWYYDFKYNSKKYFGSTKTTNKALAKKIEEEKRRSLIEQSELGQSETISLRSAIEMYRETKKQQNQTYKHIGYMMKDFLCDSGKPSGLNPNIDIHKIKDRNIHAFVMQQKSEDFSDASIIHRLGYLTRSFNLAKKLGYLAPEINVKDVKADNGVKPAKGRIRYLTLEEENKVLHELHPDTVLVGMAHPDRQTPEKKRQRQDTYDFAVMLLDFGGRHTELSTLKWSAVSMEDEAINLYRPKVNNESILSMTDRVKVILERRLAAKRPDQIYVFENTTQGPRRYTPRAFKGACNRAGLKDVSFHTLRHTFCSTLVAAGATLFEVQQLVGHTTPTMTAKYAHLAPNVASTKAVKLLNQRQVSA